MNFARRLQERGHKVDLHGPEDIELFPSLEGRAKRYRQALGMLIFCLRKTKEEQYDLIEFYGAEAWLTVSILKRRKQRPFMVIHSNGLETNVAEVLSKHPESSPPPKWYHLNQILRFEKAFKDVDGIVTVSKFERDYALDQGYQSKSRILNIDNCLLDEFLDLEIEFERQHVIAFCGNWRPIKGTQVIARDMSRLLQDYPQSVLKLIGVGEDFKKEDVFESSVCNQIEVTPFERDKNNLKAIYKSASILIMPSVYESFGLVSAEAMACGCAIIATKVGFPADLKDKEEIMHIEGPTSPHLYNATKALLIDDALRASIAKNGYDRVQSLRWGGAIDSIEKTYLQWLKNH